MRREPRRSRFSPQARDDLEQIWLYTFKTWSIEQADRYQTDIVATVAALTCGDKSGRRVSFRDGYFKQAVGMHVVFFKASDVHLDVIRILHRSMDIERHL